MKLLFHLSLLFFLLQIPIIAQILPQSAGDFQRALSQLPTQGKVLYVAAHPDDENTRLITYLAKERGFETGYLSLTRGDGGQNLIGTETGERLGLIRTQELEMARKIDGGRQFFTRAFDFGYSKSPKETFGFWNRDSLLSDVVFIIRHFQPDVIILRFPTTGEGGHGHHTASALLGLEAFAAAANANKFPEQLLGEIKPWATKRIYWNVFNWQNNNLDDKGYIKIDVGGYDALTGLSNGEVAGASRTMHQSQGFGSAKVRGNQYEYLQLLAGEQTNDPFESLKTPFGKIAAKTRKQILQLYGRLFLNYQAEHPELLTANLVNFYDFISKLEMSQPARISLLKRIEKLILASVGWYAEALAPNQTICLQDSLKLQFNAIARTSDNIALNEISYKTASFAIEEKLNKNNNFKKDITVFVDQNHPDNPYWLAEPRSSGFFDISNQHDLLTPVNTYPQNVEVLLSIGGFLLKVQVPIQYKKIEPAGGELFKPVFALPSYTLNPKTELLLFANNQPQTLQIEVKQNNLKESSKVFISANGYNIVPNEINLKSPNGLNTWQIEVEIQPKEGALPGNLVFTDLQQKPFFQQKTINYSHIPSQIWQTPTSVKLQPIALQLGQNKLLHVAGAGDACIEILGQVGFEVTNIGINDLNLFNPNQFPAVLVGIRALNIAENPKQFMQALVDYAEKGGTVVLQYQTTSANLHEVTNWPSGFVLSRLRVTNEKASPNFLVKNHPILQTPNKLTEADFEYWVQERGLYFLSDWGENAQPILSWSDDEEQPLSGGLVVAPIGKGVFVYSGISWFRQLPSGVPGAIRLLVNALALKQITSHAQPK